MTKSFSSHIEESKSNLWGSHIKVPIEIAHFFKENKINRLLCTLNNQTTIHCAIMSSAEGPYILINKQLKKSIEKTSNSLIRVELNPDLSKYGMEMSIELEQSLSEEPVILQYFEALTPGKQRNLIHLVNSVKNPEIKIRRALSIVEHLMREQGKLDFKILNEVIKEFNHRFKL